MEQRNERLEEFLNVNYEFDKLKFGIFKASKKKLNGKIDIISIESLANNEEAHELLKKYGLVIVDEVHHIAASSYEKVIRSVSSKYLFGFTATTNRSDNNEEIVFKSIGDVRHKISENSQISFEKILIPRFTNFKLDEYNSRMSYVEQCNLISSDEERNDLILNDIKSVISEKRNVLVLTERIEHCDFLFKEISKLTSSIYIYNGSLPSAKKKEFFDKIKNLTNKGAVIVATGKSLGEGFDCSVLDTLFITMPFKRSGTVKQYVGRIHRVVDGKDVVRVYDYVDIKTRMFSNMFDVRLRTYKKEKYRIEDDLNGIDNVIYDYKSYKEPFMNDVFKAKNKIIIVGKIIDASKVYKLETSAKIVVYYESCLNIDESKEIRFIKKDNLNNFIIIDNEIVYYGGLYLFSTFNLKEGSFIRIKDSKCAIDLLTCVKTSV